MIEFQSAVLFSDAVCEAAPRGHLGDKEAGSCRRQVDLPLCLTPRPCTRSLTPPGTHLHCLPFSPPLHLPSSTLPSLPLYLLPYPSPSLSLSPVSFLTLSVENCLPLQIHNSQLRSPALMGEHQGERERERGEGGDLHRKIIRTCEKKKSKKGRCC